MKQEIYINQNLVLCIPLVTNIDIFEDNCRVGSEEELGLSNTFDEGILFHLLSIKDTTLDPLSFF